MSDQKPAETNPSDAAAEKEIPTASPHHKDKGQVVKTAFGETMSGGVADIADGDDA